ncbi:MAG: DUF6629 family protein [bacterium]
MCFSASASFIASGGLATLGVATLVVSKKQDKILALIPILFAIQQFLEGIQWLYLNSGTHSTFIGYSFLFFAFIVWPVYVPSFIFILDEKRRKVLKWFVILGSIVSIYFLALLLSEPIFVSKVHACVSYTFHFPFKYPAMILYLLTVFAPLVISSLKIFRWFGLLVGIFGIIAGLFFWLTFTSVWCFFAAAVSSMFFFYIKFKGPRVIVVNK